MPHRILVCEDDVVLATTLDRLLRDHGYRTTLCRDGQGALDHLREGDCSLLVLDLMLPDMDGYDVCRRMRHFCHVPVIMISGRGSEVERIVGLEVGADDYLVKPFGVRELVARVDAQLRRTGDYAFRHHSEPSMSLGDLQLDREQHEVSVDGELVHLTPKEYDLLCVLAEHRGTVVRSSQLLLRVWGYDSDIRTRTLDVHVGRLRAKIERDCQHPRMIVTVPGVGYKLCVPEQLARAA
jgi:two-component system, OmpR family, response regulator MtrA